MNLTDKIIQQYQQQEFTDSLQNLRKNSFSLFEKNGFPTNKNEEWKYTNLNEIVAQDFNFELSEAEVSKEEISPFLLEDDTYKMVFINGKYNQNLSELPTEFTLHNLENCLDNDTVKHHLTTISKTQDEIIALNNTFFKQGVFLEVATNQQIKKPLEILYFTKGQKNVVHHTRNLVVVNKSAECTIVEKHYNLSDNVVLTNTVTELFVKENARLYFYKLQNDKTNANIIDNTFVSQDRNTTTNVDTFSFGGSFVRNNLSFYLNGENSTANLNGANILNEKQLVDNHTLVEHRVPHCDSNEVYKGVYDGSSKGVFNGKVIVYQDAQKTNGFQQNNNILLSDNAKVNTKPQLEIFADDVRCTHGCTVGQMDEEALFYLRSRGISKNEAKGLLIYAFVAETLENVKLDSLKKEIYQIMAAKLGIDFIL